jgi:5-methylcytosine-specific restriction protein B
MADYFTSEHFKLLNKWKGQKKDPSNPEQQRAYDELKAAYDITKKWADGVQAKHFPDGYVEILRKPTNQANNFSAYNWARIYPSAEAPTSLAFTVGIEAESGFVVKIDTVGLDETDPVRQEYLRIRGAYDNSSPVIAVLPITEGLQKSLPALVDWSVDAIKGFGKRYGEVMHELKLDQGLSDEDVLRHFDGKPAFKTFRASWTPGEKATFARLARAAHEAGLDWWHMTKGVQVRFGRKNPGSERATAVLGIVRGVVKKTLSTTMPLGSVAQLHRTPITADLVADLEEALKGGAAELQKRFALDVDRPAQWPDELREDSADVEDEEDESERSSSAVPQPVNRIYYGPPGTGKTFELGRLLKRDYEHSISSSQSADDWRRQFIAERIAYRKWWEGAVLALYDLGGKANVTELLKHPFIEAIAIAKGRTLNLRQTLWATLIERAVDESTTVKRAVRISPQVFDKSEDSVWRFAGGWREECADLVTLVEEYKAARSTDQPSLNYSFVTFHQSYGYEEFVEGLRPVMEENADAGGIQYEIRPGAFKSLCQRARLSPDQRFAMVIDEINRGNISKIFGELITLVEADKRDGAKNAVSVTLPYSGESFSVPPNVDIIGTMNTADRSLAVLDTALRRRFEFFPVYPDARDEEGAPLYSLRVSTNGKVIEIPRLLGAINRRIEALYDKDHAIGHSYFMALNDVPDGDERIVELGKIFQHRILPLLEEYFFEDWRKIRLVLADNQKPEALAFVSESGDHEEDLEQLFGGDHGLDSYGTKRRYQINESAFSNPDAYIGIYTGLDN